MNKEQAKKMIPDWDYIHVFKNPGMMLQGSVYERQQVLNLIEKHDAFFSGPKATKLGHELTLLVNNQLLFIQTKQIECETIPVRL